MKKPLNTSVPVTADSPEGNRATEIFRTQYNKAFLTERGAQILGKSPEFEDYLLAGIKRFSMKSPNYELVHNILGIDFISPEDVTNSRNEITYTEEQITRFGETVPTQEKLEWCRDNNFFLCPGPSYPMSLFDILNLKGDYFSQEEGGGGWYADQNFVKDDKIGTKWYMIRKNIVPESFSKNWDEQQALLSMIEKAPNAPEFVWGITLYKAVRDVSLFCGIYARTSSFDSGGDHVSVGSNSNDGNLEVDYDWDSYRMGLLGLASMRSDV